MAAAQVSEGTRDPAGAATAQSEVVHVEYSALGSQCAPTLEFREWTTAAWQEMPRAIAEKGRREDYLL